MAAMKPSVKSKPARKTARAGAKVEGPRVLTLEEARREARVGATLLVKVGPVPIRVTIREAISRGGGVDYLERLFTRFPAKRR
jgi:hypothetical protein